MPPVTVVTAYYDIPSKFDNSTYVRWITLLLRTLNCNVVFFVENEAAVTQFQPLCSWPSRVRFRIVKKDDWVMLKRKNISFWDDQLRLDSSEVGLHKSFMLGALWAEKIHFVRRAIEENPFQSDKFIWCDAGIMRTQEDANRGFLFGCNETVISDSKFHILEVGPDSGGNGKWWIPSGKQIRFGGGIFGAHQRVWMSVIPLYERILDDMANDGVSVYKDQNVWANVVRHHPDLFSITTSYANWFFLLYEWSVAPKGLNTFVINLHHRHDRWSEVCHAWSLDSHANVFRFPACLHGKHAPWLNASVTHGCAASHLSILAATQDLCLVLEDDAVPCPGVDLRLLLDQLESLQSNSTWDFVNFGTSTVTGLHQQGFGAIRSFNDLFWQTKISSTTHAIGYSARVRRLMTKVGDMVRSTFFIGEPQSNIDYILGSGLIDSSIVQLLPKQGVLAMQRALSHSDISHNVVDYTYMFELVQAQLSSMKFSWIPVPMPIVADMQGGLGNQLFIAAAALRFAQMSGRPFALCRKAFKDNPHSSQNYMDTIFKHFPQVQSVPMHWCSVVTSLAECTQTKSTLVPRLRGYFQTADHVTDEFKRLLTLPAPESLEDSAVLMHIRGGDFKTTSLHNVDLTNFRKRALSCLPSKSNVRVLSDDEAETTRVLQALRLTAQRITESNEVQLLSNIAHSTAPLICANSSFSWWAAALSKHDRLVFLPQTWYTRADGHEDESALFRLRGVFVV